MITDILLLVILLPIVLGILCLIIPKKLRILEEGVAIIGSLIVFVMTLYLFLNKPLEWVKEKILFLKLDTLSGFVLLAIGLFGFLITLYSLRFMREKQDIGKYYVYILWTIGASCGAVLSNNLILLLIFWGFLGLTLYLLIATGGQESSQAAKKTFIIVGGSDALFQGLHARDHRVLPGSHRWGRPAADLPQRDRIPPHSPGGDREPSEGTVKIATKKHTWSEGSS